MTKHSDPRFGEITYRLTRIDRREPPPSLFQVPPDYKILEAKKTVEVMRDRFPPKPIE
jgi:hypothetical protein